MTLRTKSKAQQWLMWIGAALAAAVIYVILSRILCDSVSLDLLDARRYRFALPLAIAFVVFAWETRWDGVRREKKEEVGRAGLVTAAVGEKVKVAIEAEGRNSRSEANGLRQGQERTDKIPFLNLTCSLDPNSDAINASLPLQLLTPTPLAGEAEYVQARGIKHRKIPEYGYDDEYLDLLVKSAELGYPQALAKLGDYAMRRGWIVEAYYWLWRAKRGGMGNLDRTMLQMRSAWARGGYSREQANTSKCFSYEQGTIGYALLCIDARHNEEAAKARLAECAPDFLS